MAVLCSLLLVDIASGFIRSYQVALQDQYGAEVLNELSNFNEIIAASVIPSDPHLIDLKLIKAELIESGNVKDLATGYLAIECLKALLVI